MATEEHTTRRNILKALPAGLMAALVAGDVHAAVDALSAENDILSHAVAIHRALKANVPEGAWVNGFQFRCVDGEIVTETIWASAMTDNYLLIHARPAVYDGWRRNGEAA